MRNSTVELIITVVGQSLRKEEEMAKCKNCGVDIDKHVNLCPKCGLNPSVETITSVLKKSRDDSGATSDKVDEPGKNDDKA